MSLSGPTPDVAFIVGCGRSGTTITGRILSQHPDVAFLNDRADLWIRAFPVADIWGRSHSSIHEARIELKASDAQPDRVAAFKHLIEDERRGKDSREKVPINSFRLEFLFAIFPTARLINVTRNGVEVAHSIAARAARGSWYEGRKWLHLTEYAYGHGYGSLAAICTTPFLRGLLEWRMIVDAIDAYLANHSVQVLNIRHEQLRANPVGLVMAMEDFVALPHSEEVKRYAASEVGHFRPTNYENLIPDEAEEVAGDTLRRLGYWPAK